MEFFDLNVPYHGGGGDKKLEAQKNARLKVAVKAMELGYSGVAYNHSIRGVTSDSDRCSIYRFPLPSLLKFAPPLSAAVKFHRNLLGVPPNTPFRQYTRLTVSVDNVIDAAALNSGNPVLRTYDLVAVMPLNQAAFDLACKVSEVDLIAIDFSQSLPFRLKPSMINAAMKRGIYFEITYCHLIADVEIRRQVLSGAKMLVDWTRGKNIIFTSAATSACEVRGPNDVANLSVLLGLSMEKAKASISKNCGSVLVCSLHKKQYYREAIKVERIMEGEALLSKSWDPISSGEGDLSLDEIAKSFSDARKVPSSINWCGKSFQSSSDTSIYKFSVKELVSARHPEGTSSSSDLFDDIMPVNDAALKDQTSDVAASKAETGDPAARTTLSTGLDSCIDEKPSSSWSKDQSSEAKGLDPSLSNNRFVRIAGPSLSPNAGATQPDVNLSNILASNREAGIALGNENVTLTASAKVTSRSEGCVEEIRRLDGLDSVGKTCDTPMEQLLENLIEEQQDAKIACVEYIVEDCAGIFKESATIGLSTDEFHFKEKFMKMDEQKQDSAETPGVAVEEGLVEMQGQEEEEMTGTSNKFIEIKAKSGKNKRKRKPRQAACLLPFKGIAKCGASSKKWPRRLLR